MADIENNSGDMTQSSGLERFISRLDKTGATIDAVSGAVCVFLIAVMTIVVLVGVFFRYVVGNPFMWSEELARFLMLWSGFLAINIAMRRDAHIRIDFIFKALPFVIRKMVEYTVDLIMIAFLVFLVIRGYDLTTGSIMKAMSMDFSMSWIYLSVPVGAFLTLVQLLLMVLRKTLLAFFKPVLQPGQ